MKSRCELVWFFDSVLWRELVVSFKITLMANIVGRYIFPSDSPVVCQIMAMRQGWLRYRNR